MENVKVRVLVEWGTVENLKRLLVFCAGHIDHAQVDRAQAVSRQRIPRIAGQGPFNLLLCLVEQADMNVDTSQLVCRRR